MHRPDRPSPFYLVWTEDGHERKQSFKDEKSREITAKALAEKREKHGTAVLTFDPEKWRTFERFLEIVGNDTDPLKVAHEWKTIEQSRMDLPTLTTTKAIEQYMKLRKEEGGVDLGYLAHMKVHLVKSFGARLGHILLHELDAQMIREWLASLKDERKLGHLARRHYYKSVGTFLNRCVREQWIEESPCKIVTVPQPTMAELAKSDIVKLMPVGDVEKLFRANRDQRCVGKLALEAFGGVRYTTAGKMEAEHIDFERRALTMPGHIHKGRKRKYRQGHPDCLWAWLKHAPKDCWTITPRDYMEMKSHAFIRAGVTNPHNGLRHSFASYLLAHTKSLPTVSYLMQHSTTSMTEKYEGRANEQDAAKYLAITPESVK